jgi:beta-lactamase class A
MPHVIKKERFLLNIKIPAYWILIASLVFFILINTLFSKIITSDIPAIISKTKCTAPLNIIRENDYKLVHPILIADVKGEDKKYNQLKEKISGYIESNKKSFNITSASVYFNELNAGSHFSINQEQQYSLNNYSRIGMCVNLLKQNENNPSFLEKQILFKGSSSPSSSGMIANQTYSIKNLINRMVADYDLCAKELLIPMIDSKIRKNIFDAIQVQLPDKPDKPIKMTVSDYSKFLKLFYNAGFLSIDDSEFMLQLLTHTKYINGITKYLESNIKVSHFYSKNEDVSAKQLNEFGVIYLHDKPYLLGIMTEGNNMEKQSSVIADISRMVFEELNKAI